MMSNNNQINSNAKIIGVAALKAAIFTAAIFASGVAMAAGTGADYAGADQKVCGFLSR